MIFRPLSLICFLTAAGFGWNLYQVKHRTALLDRELASVAEQIKAAQKQKETLESVWGTLNDLPRLRQLSQQLLPIETSQTPQNRSFVELDRRLPPAQVFDGQRSAFAPREGVSAPGMAIALLPPPAPQAAPVQLASVAPAALAASMPPAPEVPAAPAQLAAPVSVPAPAAELLAEEEVLPLPPPLPPHLLALAEPRAPAPRPVAAPAANPVASPAPTPRPALHAVASAASSMGLAAPVSYARPARPLPAPVAPEAPARSMLGGMGTPLLAPPVPFGTANAASLGGYAR